jgi:hypothetical protein
MKTYEVRRIVNSVKNDTPECVAPKLCGILQHLAFMGVSAAMLPAAILLAGRALERNLDWPFSWAQSVMIVGLMESVRLGPRCSRMYHRGLGGRHQSRRMAESV